MAIKELQTRIALKYDSFENWQKSDLVLLPGELGICTIGTTTETGKDEATTNPTVLFKVGDGTTPAKNLKWASALAADVYNWAKSKTVVLDGKVLKFKTGTTVNHTVDLSTFALASDVSTLSGEVAEIKASLGGSGDIDKAIDDVEARLDVIEGTGEGSIEKAKADAIAAAQEYTNTETANFHAALTNDMQTALTAVEERLTGIETKNSTQDSEISENAYAIAKEVTDRTNAVSALDTAYKAADKAINDKIGGSYSSSATVHAAIVDAKKAGTDAASAVSTLETTKVDKNTRDIATNTGEIAKNTQAISAEVTRATGVEADFESRISAMETFWDTTADTDGVVNKLKEIQEYIESDESGAATMAGNIQKNAQDIEALQNIVKDGGTLETRVDQAEADIGAVEGRTDTLEATVAGYNGTNTVKKAIDAVSARAEKGITDAATADGKAVAAQNTANDVKAAVENTTTGLAATKKIADDAAADLAKLTTRVGTAEGNITTIQSLVTGANGNDKLRADITTIQNLVNHATKGNEQLRTELTTLQGVVNNETTGLAATKAIADAAKSKADTNEAAISEIQKDYLKAADDYVFNCGTSSTVVHVATAE